MTQTQLKKEAELMRSMMAKSSNPTPRSLANRLMLTIGAPDVPKRYR